MEAIFKQKRPPTKDEMQTWRFVAEHCARIAPLCEPTPEWGTCKLTFEFRVVDGKLQIQNVLLEKGPQEIIQTVLQ
jgi:hypothetical protein